MSNLKKLKKYGPWALILGSSEGLGYAFAENCAEQGLNVILTGRKEAKLQAAADKLKAAHKVDVKYFTCDITDPECAKKLTPQLDDYDIGLFVYNAACEPGGPFVRLPIEDINTAIRGNGTTAAEITWYIARKMAKRGRGFIGLVTSLASMGGMAYYVPYSASKGYELLLGEGLWYELKEYGVDAATFVVGETATPNYNKTQDKKADEDKGKKKTFGERERRPITPDECADNLMAQIGDGPRLYANPKDKRSVKLLNMMSDKMRVSFLSKAAMDGYDATFNNLLDL